MGVYLNHLDMVRLLHQGFESVLQGDVSVSYFPVLEMWIFKQKIIRDLQGFHHCFACQIIVCRMWYFQVGGWAYPDIEKYLEEANMLPIVEYISLFQNTSLDYLQMITIFDISVEETSFGSTSVFWWYQKRVRIATEDQGGCIVKDTYQ